MTGLAYPRAQVFYRAAMTGDWSKIKDDELAIQQKLSWGSKLQMQLATVIAPEKARRKTEEERRKIEEEMQEEFERSFKEEPTLGTNSKSENRKTSQASPAYSIRYLAGISEPLAGKGQ